jgi:hypothetical protein
MASDELEQEVLLIRSALEHTAGHRINSAGAIWELIEQSGEESKSILLQEAAENWDEYKGGGGVKVSETYQVLPDELEAYSRRMGDLADSVLASIVDENLTTEEFYARLVEVLENPIFPDTKAKVFAVYYMMIDPLLPYFQAKEFMPISNERYVEVQKEIRKHLKKINHFLSRKFEQRSMQAEAVLDAINELPTTEGRAVAMSLIVAVLDDGKEARRVVQQSRHRG